MSVPIQFRRGSTVDRMAVTLDSGEPGWDTTLKKLFMGDGTTPGGVAVGDVTEAPIDGKEYARKDGTWVEITGTGGGGVFPKFVVFTASDTFPLPSTALPYIDYDVLGGGGAGGGVSSGTNVGQGGGGGGARHKGMATGTPGTNYTILVGAGGVGTTGANGGNGGSSEITGIIVAAGGLGATGTNGGRSGNGSPPNPGQSAAAARQNYSAISGGGGSGGTTAGGHGAIGDGGECSGGGAGGGIPGNAGLSAGGGDGSPGNSAGGDAITPGSGGGGAYRTSTNTDRGGHGFRGEVRIRYWDTVP